MLQLVQVPLSPRFMSLPANMMIGEREVRAQQAGERLVAQSYELATTKLRAIPGNQETNIEAKSIKIKSTFETNKCISRF